jgi:hypothetical protein
MASPRRKRGAVAGAVLGAVVALLASPAAAQWKIHIAGRGEPMDADFYGEETPWVFFRFKEDRSMYLFTLGCDRILRVERDGVELPRLDCPLPRLPTTMPRLYGDIVEREAKLLDESLARLGKDVDALKTVSAGAPTAAADNPAARERQLQANQQVTEVLTRQINRTFQEIESIDRRIDALVLAAKAYPPPEKPRYFFFRR